MVKPRRLRSGVPAKTLSSIAGISVLAACAAVPDASDEHGVSSTVASSTVSQQLSNTPYVTQVEMPQDIQESLAEIMASWQEGPDAAQLRDGRIIPVQDTLWIEAAEMDSVSGDLSITVVGAPLGDGPCMSEQEIAVQETDSAVAVLVTPIPSSVSASCFDQGHFLTLPVTLDIPLGDRALIDGTSGTIVDVEGAARR